MSMQSKCFRGEIIFDDQLEAVLLKYILQHRTIFLNLQGAISTAHTDTRKHSFGMYAYVERLLRREASLSSATATEKIIEFVFELQSARYQYMIFDKRMNRQVQLK